MNKTFVPLLLLLKSNATRSLSRLQPNIDRQLNRLQVPYFVNYMTLPACTQHFAYLMDLALVSFSCDMLMVSGGSQLQGRRITYKLVYSTNTQLCQTQASGEALLFGLCPFCDKKAVAAIEHTWMVNGLCFVCQYCVVMVRYCATLNSIQIT